MEWFDKFFCKACGANRLAASDLNKLANGKGEDLSGIRLLVSGNRSCFSHACFTSIRLRTNAPLLIFPDVPFVDEPGKSELGDLASFLIYVLQHRLVSQCPPKSLGPGRTGQCICLAKLTSMTIIMLVNEA
jgi:hypothetical protein